MKAMAWVGSDGRQWALLTSEAARGGFWPVALCCLIALIGGLLAAVTPRGAAAIDTVVIGRVAIPPLAPLGAPATPA
jgi:hypothetical protein